MAAPSAWRKEGPDISQDTHAPARGGPAAWRAAAVTVGAAWLVSRVAAALAGVRFDAEHLRSGWQLLDLPWLRADLLGSLWHLHSQPPLHNLLAGIATTVAPGREAGAFHVLHLLIGLGLGLGMVAVLKRLGVSPLVAGVATTLFVVSPAAIVWENNLSYMHPLAAVLVLAVWAFARFGAEPTLRRGVVAFGIAAVPSLTWSLWHLLWLVGLAGAVAVSRAVPVRRLLAAAAIPIVVVGAWYGKNLLLVSEPVASTWMGVNLFRVATAEVDRSELERMVARSEIDPVALVEEFSPLAAYDGVVPMPPPMGHPAMDEATKANGSPNFNALGFLEVSRAFGTVATTVLRTHPRAYVTGVATGACVFAKPATDYWAVGPNRDRIGGWDRLYSGVVYGQLRTPPLDEGCRLRWAAQGEVALWLPLLYAGALAGTAILGLRRREPPGVRVGAVFMAAALGWVALAGNVFELGENQRFRWVTEPLMWVALALVVDRLLHWFRRWRVESSEPADAASEPLAGASTR